jgi:hypothetical protein
MEEPGVTEEALLLPGVRIGAFQSKQRRKDKTGVGRIAGGDPPQVKRMRAAPWHPAQGLEWKETKS